MATELVLQPLKQILKVASNGVGLAAAFLPALTCWLESRLLGRGREEVFRFWAEVFALFPSTLGDYLRKCFYRLTLRSCSLECTIRFMSQFTDREAEVAKGVYVGTFALVGTASLGEGCLVGSRVSILSGSSQHEFDEDGHLTAADRTAFQRVRIGSETWIGEAAVIMADVGSRCIVSAGAVVSHPAPDGCIVAGNPCRFVGKTTVEREEVTVRADPVTEQGDRR